MAARSQPVTATATAATSGAEPSAAGITPTAMRYWLSGHDIIEACLRKAVEADPNEAPFPLFGSDAKLWHNAQMEAYRHALEMMGVPEHVRAALQNAPSQPAAREDASPQGSPGGNP